MKKYHNFMNGVTKITSGFLAILLSATVVMIFYQVIARYIIGTTPPYLNELSMYSLIWISFFGSSIAIRWNKHVAVDILLNRLSSKRAKKSTYIIIQLFGLTFLVILFLALFQYTLSQWGQYSETMGFRMTWPALGTVLGTFLMILQMIENIISPNPKELEEGEV